MPSHFFDWFRQQRDFSLIVPQVQLALFGMGILLTDFLLDRKSRYWNALLALVGIGFSALALRHLSNVEDASAFAGAIIVDPFSVFFGFLFLISAALVVLL